MGLPLETEYATWNVYKTLIIKCLVFEKNTDHITPKVHFVMDTGFSSIVENHTLLPKKWN